MKKFKVSWYDQEEVKYTEPDIIEAESREACEKIAYTRHNGKPPAPCIFIEEVM